MKSRDFCVALLKGTKRVCGYLSIFFWYGVSKGFYLQMYPQQWNTKYNTQYIQNNSIQYVKNDNQVFASLEISNVAFGGLVDVDIGAGTN